MTNFFKKPMNPAPKMLFKIDDSQLIGKGCYGSLYPVLASTGDIIAALKVCNTIGVMNQKMHASWQEFHILKKARIEQAEHIINAFHDYPSGTNNSIQFEMEYVQVEICEHISAITHSCISKSS